MGRSELHTGDIFVSSRQSPENVGVVIASGSEASDCIDLFVAGWFEPNDNGIRIEHSVLVNVVIEVTGKMTVQEIIQRMKKFGSPSSMGTWIPFLEEMIE